MKKNVKISLLLSLITIVLLSGCRNMYIPNMPNTPLLKEKGDITVSLNPNNYQAAFAITESIGIMANGYYRRNSWNIASGNFENRYTNQRYMAEGAIGYFKKLGSSAVFEAYAGAGVGNVKFNYDLYDNKVLIDNNSWSANNVKYFFQPNFGIVNDNVELALTTRFVVLNFNNPKISSNFSEEEMVIERLNGLDKVNWMFIEPGVVFKYGFKNIKLQNHLLYSSKLNPEALNTKNLIFGFGMSVRF
jgi:hypothetical protein